MDDQIIQIPVINISAETGLINIEDNFSEKKSQASNRSRSSKQSIERNLSANSKERVENLDTKSLKPEEEDQNLTEKHDNLEEQPTETDQQNYKQDSEPSEENIENFRSPELLDEIAPDSPKPFSDETNENLKTGNESDLAENIADTAELNTRDFPKSEEISQDQEEDQPVVVSQPTALIVFQVSDPSELISYRPFYRNQFIWAYVNMLIFLPLLVWIPGLLTATYSKKYYRINDFIISKKFVRRTKDFNIFAILIGKLLNLIKIFK